METKIVAWLSVSLHGAKCMIMLFLSMLRIE
jgi:hypothetical protein